MKRKEFFIVALIDYEMEINQWERVEPEAIRSVKNLFWWKGKRKNNCLCIFKSLMKKHMWNKRKNKNSVSMLYTHHKVSFPAMFAFEIRAVA
jgi:hypothetical protein